MATMHKVGYMRVTTGDQNSAQQLDDIELDRTFEDKASGLDTDRPQLKETLAYVRGGNTVVVRSLDWLGRNLDDLRSLVFGLTKKGVRVQFVKENLTFSGEDLSFSNFMLSMPDAVSEFERTLIRERQREGIALAKARGAYKGRPKSLKPEQVQQLRDRVALGVPKAEVARQFGIGRDTVYEYLRA